MNQIAPGQRYVSEAEPELGMGLVASHDKRSLTLFFPLNQCTRCYSKGGAPIQRVIFKPGDLIQTESGQSVRVESIEEKDGLITYLSQGQSFPEDCLSMDTGFSLPQEKLMAGLVGDNKAFNLRYDILTHRSRQWASPCRGFLGGRLEPIPHQFYIAQEVCNRHLPRVMLSDETGLGKTIEACMIIHRLLVSHKISRVLIIVPDALVHQWFVELYRKFNLSFHIFQDTLGEDHTDNPFSSAQHGIISQSLIQGNTPHGAMALEAQWDMVVVDEAHHILDDQSFYSYMASLARETQGLLLLSATPEQMGLKTHFAQLALLDPDRYFDFNAYLEESKQFQGVAEQVDQLIARGEDPGLLLDAHGPGRVIFRNTRAAIKGFPKRKAHMIRLPGNQKTRARLAKEFKNPCSIGPRDLETDPRIQSLFDLSRKLDGKKILVICDSRQKALAIEKALQSKGAIETARFDETMTLMQRDRNAAYFAREDGARLLICSEIGSEGRNFQFVHHLFLFDLPLNPEHLEQRIGRVDRIGQKNDIHIHVPHVENTPQEILARWYMEGVNLFEENANGLHRIFLKFKDALDAFIQLVAGGSPLPQREFADLIQKTKAHCKALNTELSQGKNRLLELNSYKREPALKLLAQIGETDDDPRLKDLLNRVLDQYHLGLDPVDEHLWTLEAEDIPDENFPPIPANARVLSFDRATAIAREDIAFFNWDHPFVNQVMEFFLTHGSGESAVAKVKADPGLFLECIFVLESQGTPQLNIEPFLPTKPLKVVVNHFKQDLTQDKNYQTLSQTMEPDFPHWIKDLNRANPDMLPELIDHCRQLVEIRVKKLKEGAQKEIQRILGGEVDRLLALGQVNPNIRKDEILAAQRVCQQMLEKLEGASLRLDAIRLIRAEP